MEFDVDQYIENPIKIYGPEDFRYGVIYLDPNWKFEVYDRDTGNGRSAESHYHTMPIEEMKKINMARLAKDDCVMFIWIVWTHLPQALELVASWGFEYKTLAFLWTKLNPKAGLKIIPATDHRLWFMGMGFWTRANTEGCFLFTRGNPHCRDHGVRQLIVSPRRLHSQKPDEAYERIERLVKGPYIEVFARNTRSGWASLGDEIDGRDLREILK